MSFYPNEDNRYKALDPNFEEALADLDEILDEAAELAGTSSETSGNSSSPPVLEEPGVAATEPKTSKGTEENPNPKHSDQEGKVASTVTGDPSVADAAGPSALENPAEVGAMDPAAKTAVDPLSLASEEKDAGTWENGGSIAADDPDDAEFAKAFPNIHQRRQKWTKRIPDVRTACAYASLNHSAFDPDFNGWVYRVEEYRDVEDALAILLRLNELGVPAPAFRQIQRLPKSAYRDPVQQGWSRALQVCDLHWLVLWHPDHVEYTSWSGLITAEGVLNFGKAWRFAGMRPSKGIDDKVVNQLDLTRHQQRELYMLFGSAEKAMRKSWFQGKGQGSQRSALRKMMQNAEHSPGPNPDANVAADRLTALAMAVLNSKSGKPSPTDVAKFCYLIRGEVVAPTNVPKRIQGPVERHLGSDYNWLPQD